MSLKYQGCSMFRQRIVMSLLSGKSLKINNIRQNDSFPGIQDFEADFLRIIEKMCDGCLIEINEIGTSVYFRPGLLVGGSISHECAPSRGVGWHFEGLLALAPFCKHPLSLSLTGVTHCSNQAGGSDWSTDFLSLVTLPKVLPLFGVLGSSLTVARVGCAPLGGGVATLTMPVVRALKPVALTQAGKVKRVRGVVFCARLSPAVAARVIDAARAVLNNLLPDVRIASDCHRGNAGGKCAGFSLLLIAETDSGVSRAVERSASAGETPELVGEECALMLLQECSESGCVDRAHQGLSVAMMAAGPEDVSRLRLGPLSESAIESLRLIRDAFGVVFKIRAVRGEEGEESRERGDKRMRRDDDDENDEDEDDEEIEGALMSCLGAGFKNMARKAA